MNFSKWLPFVGFLLLSPSLYPGDFNEKGLDLKPEPAVAMYSPVEWNSLILPAFLDHYLDIKNALIEDAYVQAKKAAAGMEQAVQNSNLNAEQQTHLQIIIGELIIADHIEGQRIAFAVLSEQLYQILPGIDFGSETLFWQNCPMALGGRGGNWISLEEQVKNPFMGQRMPTCGTTLEKLKKQKQN